MTRMFRVAKLAFFNPKLFFRKVRNEFSAPTNGFIGVIRKIYFLFAYRASITAESNDDRLLFIYDTRLNPITFDFLNYLYYANWLRKESGAISVDILLISEKNMTGRHEASYILAIGTDNIKWRVFNLLIPLARLFSSVGRIYVVESNQVSEVIKNYRNIHPKEYTYVSPKSAAIRLDLPSLSFIPSLSISVTAREIVAAYYPKADDRRIITITLRTYDYIPARNSDVKSWVDFAGELDSTKYRIIFVPDASKHGVAMLEQIDGFEIFDSACWNIELRAALYQLAWINMGVASGPLTISAMMDDTITLIIDRSLDYPADYFENIRSGTGAVLGNKPNCYSNSCHFFLGRDDKETIQKIFYKYGG